MVRLNEVVTDWQALSAGYINRNGFIFSLGDKASVFDRLVIRSPLDAVGPPFVHGFSKKTLDEHIALINEYQLEKAIIVCDDLSFLLKCPSLSDIIVCPANSAGNAFNYSPLYQMPGIRKLSCDTQYGYFNMAPTTSFNTTIDYSKLPDILALHVRGKGHNNYNCLATLEHLWLSCDKKHKDFKDVSRSSCLRGITLLQCGIQTLVGISMHRNLQELTLVDNKALTDISALRDCAESIRSLTIENCSKLKDFSVLEHLVYLEHLHLYGNNTIPNLGFLSNMQKLKTFRFTINIEDGDLSSCMSIPYVSCKNRKHYNLKDKQLPKEL